MFLAILQGFSELFPVSSLGHIVLVPAILRWHVDRADPSFLAFVVVLHFGTALALVVYYWSEWRGLIAAFFRSIARGKMSHSLDERTAWLLVAATIPVGLLGGLLEQPVRALFANPLAASIFLTINGGIMFFGESLRVRQHRSPGRPYRKLDSLPWIDGVKVGFAEALALLPGISRSGSAMVAGLLLDLTHAEAARYSFLLATPVIVAATLFELPNLFAPGVHLALMEALVGAVLAGVTAYLSVAYLVRYFQTKTLIPFAWYCVAAGIVCILLFR
ncbi:undecaprenyl-diphosphate phosphatase [bacterium]|nr:MAG: undecaprenyl-diphosphate phosphatase [bacterium]